MNDKHWTNNPELIERFVLHKMNPEERNELEDHLRICEVCKRAVRNEQHVVAGIRRSGREQFRAELKKKLPSAEPEEKEAPWIQILSAAAVVVILLTVGIYNRWFETQKESPNTSVAVQSQQAGGADARQPAELNKGESLTGEQSAEKRERPPASPQLAAKSSSQDEIRRVATSPRASVPPPTTMKAEEQVNRRADGANAETAIREMEFVKGATVSGSETIWIEGNILPTDSDALHDKAKAQEKVGIYDFRKTDARSARSADPQAELKQSESNLVLNQQNSLALPTAQQQIQQLNKSSNVMTRLKRVGSQTQLTLYLDSLIDEKELSNATVETLRNDSLILHFSNQRIGYKLPAGWSMQRDATPAK